MTDYKPAFGRIGEAVAALPLDVLVDGEAVVLHADGHSDFGALRTRAGGADAVMVVFDVLAVTALYFLAVGVSIA
ncbi:MAG: hypothetical protein JWM36_2700 [Hyphomicrobiales bacterium]|nr:hypothetical protein [Hyphomicrobiales bacterium]